MDLKLLKMRFKDSKQHHVMFHEFYSVSLLLCFAQNVRFEIRYKVLYFETPFLIIFKYCAWVSCAVSKLSVKHYLCKPTIGWCKKVEILLNTKAVKVSFPLFEHL